MACTRLNTTTTALLLLGEFRVWIYSARGDWTNAFTAQECDWVVRMSVKALTNSIRVRKWITPLLPLF